MKISVVIPAYNEEKYIHLPIESLAQQIDRDFELIVSMNNCTDDTRGVIERIGSKYDIDIMIIEEKMAGVAYARNKGFNSATGDIVASCDADTRYPKDWIEKIRINFENEDIVALYGAVWMDSKRKILNLSAKYLFTWFLQVSHFFGNYNFNGMNFAIKKSVFDKFGGFNTNWKSAEDVYIALQAKKLGRVKFDKNLICYTNDRRFKEKSGKALWHHIKNYTRVFLLKKEPLDFTAIR